MYVVYRKNKAETTYWSGKPVFGRQNTPLLVLTSVINLKEKWEKISRAFKGMTSTLVKDFLTLFQIFDPLLRSQKCLVLGSKIFLLTRLLRGSFRSN